MMGVTTLFLARKSPLSMQDSGSAMALVSETTSLLGLNNIPMSGNNATKHAPNNNSTSKYNDNMYSMSDSNF